MPHTPEHRPSYDRSNALAIFALIAALIALGFAIAAYNRSGPDLQDQAAQETQEALVAVRLGFARLEAATELAAIRAAQETDQNYDTFERDVAAVRSRLGTAYREAERETSQEWQELNAQLQQLENQIRARSANALAALEAAIEALRREVRTDEND